MRAGSRRVHPPARVTCVPGGHRARQARTYTTYLARALDSQLGEAYLNQVTAERPNEAGTAVVVQVQVRRGGATLSARRHTGEAVSIDLSARLDYAAARRDALAVHRPLAVLITVNRRGDCVLLGTSRRGPSRRTVSLGSALALCRSGVHTVLTIDAA
jgi:hypothetical protein